MVLLPAACTMGTKRPPETTAAPATVEPLRKSRREAERTQIREMVTRLRRERSLEVDRSRRDLLEVEGEGVPWAASRSTHSGILEW